MGGSSLPRSRGRHRRVQPKTWHRATPPRLLGYAVAVFVTVIAVGSAHHGTAAAPVPAPQAVAAAPAAQLLPAEATSTAPDLSFREPESEPVVAVEAPPETPRTTTRPTPTAEPEPTPVQATETPEPTVQPTTVSATTSQSEEPTPSATAPPSEPMPPSESMPPSETPSETAPPSETQPPTSSEPERPRLLPRVGELLDGLTRPLLGR